MGFLDFTRKVFGDNDHNRLSWQIAKEVYGRDIAMSYVILAELLRH